MKKTAIKVIVIVLCVIAAYWMPLAFQIHACLRPDPEITYAEFPVEITYEIHGKEKTVNETYIFEYARSDPTHGYLYDYYCKGTSEETFVLYEAKDSHVVCRMFWDYDYMYLHYDRENIDDLLENTPYVYAITNEGSPDYDLTEEQLLEQYGIKIISWTISAPLDADGNALIQTDSMIPADLYSQLSFCSG